MPSSLDAQKHNKLLAWTLWGCLPEDIQLYSFLTLVQHGQRLYQNRILRILINIFDRTHPGILLIQFQQNRCFLKSSHPLSYTLLSFSNLLAHPIPRHFLQALLRLNPAFFLLENGFPFDASNNNMM